MNAVTEEQITQVSHIFIKEDVHSSPFIALAKVFNTLTVHIGKILVALIVPCFLLLLWHVASDQGWIAQQILPKPEIVWATFSELWSSGDLLFHTGLSLQRVLWGFLLGGSLGILLGVTIGLSKSAQAYIEPIFVAIAQVPPLGWIPLVMLLVGIDEALKIIVIAKAAIIPVTINTYLGIQQVSQRYREVGKVLTFSRWDTLRKIVLPAAWPSIFTGIRYGLANAWMALVAVELLASYDGLGYLIVWGRQMFQLDQVLVAMVVVGVIGFVFDWTLSLVEKRLQSWKVNPS
jgi:sulfonate transport system permease protein